MFKTKKKFYKEVKCLACSGTGKASGHFRGGIERGTEEFVAALLQGFCFACKDRGTQTVLEREE